MQVHELIDFADKEEFIQSFSRIPFVEYNATPWFFWIVKSAFFPSATRDHENRVSTWDFRYLSVFSQLAAPSIPLEREESISIK